MKIEAVKNEMMEHIGDFVRTEAKENFVLCLKDKALPAAREVAAAYTAALGKIRRKRDRLVPFPRPRVPAVRGRRFPVALRQSRSKHMAEKQGGHPAPQGD